jgi:hypothetical protein
MAGPSIVVRVLGDFKNLAAGFAGVGKSAQTTSAQIHGAFSGMLARLNSSGVLGPFGESLSTIDQALYEINEKGKNLGKTMAVAGGAAAAVGTGLAALGSKDQAAHAQLQSAVEATGKAYEGFEGDVERAIKTQERYGNTADKTQDALRILTQATGDPKKAIELLGTASDLAAAKHEELGEAATQLGKVYNGNTKILKEFGVTAGVSAKAATAALTTATKQAETADKNAAAAKERLAELEQRLNVAHKTSAVSSSGLEAAQKRLSAAQQRLADTEALLSGKHKLTLSDEIRLRNAHQAVTDAAKGVADAHAKYAAALTAANKPVGLSVSQQQQLKHAQDAVKTTSAAAAAAHAKLSAAQAQAGKSAHTQQDAVTQLGNKLKGQASDAANTFSGHIKEVRAHLEDSAATLGKKYGPAITAAGAGMSVLGTSISVTKSVLDKFKKSTDDAKKATDAAKGAQDGLKAATETSTAVTEASTGAREAQAVATDTAAGSTDALAVSEAGADAAGLPLIATIGLIVLAVAALVAIGYVIYRNWTTIWKAIKEAAEAVFNWIKHNWPLLLGILLGPIGLAVVLIIKHWHAIWDGIKAVFSWIQHNWPLLLAIITGPIGLAVLWIVRHWQDITNAFASVIKWFQTAWKAITNFITGPVAGAVTWITQHIEGLFAYFAGLPSRVFKLFQSIWGGIESAFKAVINTLIGVWNTLASHLSVHIHVPIPFTKGIHVDTPQLLPNIPTLAQGGLLTSDGLVYAHAGEVIAPIDKVPRGPAVHVEHAHFESEIDIDLFMRRAAWAVQTTRT